jgi:hypothetical protein
LIAGGGGVRAAFGHAVALAGDRALIGAPGDDEAGGGAGAAYVFVRESGGWRLEAKLMAADPSVDAQFGSALALADGRALIGAYRDGERARLSGAVYVFERDADGWHQRQKLSAKDARARQYFGFSVALADDTALIGAWGDDERGPNAGALYLFRRQAQTWVQQQKLTPSASGSRVGVAVALTGTRALAAGYPEERPERRIGAGYLFDLADRGLSLSAQLRAGPASPSDRMAVALTADAALLGLSHADDTGSVAFFRLGLGADEQAGAEREPDCALAEETIGAE